jgi:hypothetical protein
MAMVRARGLRMPNWSQMARAPGGRVPGHVGGVLGAAKAAARLRSVGHSLGATNRRP